MMLASSDKAMLVVSEMTGMGNGKRPLPAQAPAQPRLKKPLKNLKTLSENPMMSTWQLDTTPSVDDWQSSLLAAAQLDKQEEFVLPPGLEAFANKIGLGQDQESELNLEWADLSNVGSEKASKPAQLFHNYAAPPPEEYVLVSPIEAEGRQITRPDVEETSNNNTINIDSSTATSTAISTDTATSEADNNNLTNLVLLTDETFAELREFLDNGMATLAEMEVDGEEPIAVPEDENFDIVEFAIGESGLDQEENVTEATEATMDVSGDIGNMPDLAKIKSEPEQLDEMQPVENVSIEIIEERPRKRRRTAGRPINQNPIEVTEIPKSIKLSHEDLQALKYQRTRDLNNKASRRFRLRKKEKEEQQQQELLNLESRNLELRLILTQKEKELAFWTQKVSTIKD